MSLTTATTTGTTTGATATTATTATTTKKLTATAVFLKWKSKLWRWIFIWDQFENSSFVSFVASYAFFGDKSVQTKVVIFI